MKIKKYTRMDSQKTELKTNLHLNRNFNPPFNLLKFNWLHLDVETVSLFIILKV